ncbi:MAG: type V CRISPR-associated protein Cas12k [Cyanobacteria bacterium P01_C01_bin.70]
MLRPFIISNTPSHAEPPRPSKPLYQGQQNIVLGVSFGLEKPVAIAIVDLDKDQTITARSAKQLLRNDYEQLSAYRHEQRHNSSQRRKNQRQRKSAEISEHRRGLHINRLLAKAIVNLAQEYQAGFIVLADCKGIRDRIQSGIEAKAEQKYPKDIKRQKAYLKQYRINVHKWDYGRLSQCIRDRAGKLGISVEVAKQPYQGDLTSKAAQVAFNGAKVLSS